MFLQVECQKYGVANIEAIVREICLRLVFFEAAESSELRFALGDLHDGVGSLLANVVSQQTVNEGGGAVSVAIDSGESSVRWRTRASVGPSSS